MQRSTSDIPECASPADIQLVTSVALADRLADAAGGRLVLPEHLTQRVPSVRCHVALIGDRVVGWARSVTVVRAAWCASMFVAPDVRRQGIGSALTAATLRADRSAELSKSVLVASHVGLRLYAAVGYSVLGRVLVWVPGRQ
jgi:GNAT superfamily N-acetyltransferase